MRNLNIDAYPPDERELYCQHELLLDAWKLELSKSGDPTMVEAAEYMTKDGFYPYYTKQKTKILYIGRDSYGMLGCDYLDTFYKVYRWDKVVGGEGKKKTLNQHHFNARLLHVAWGLLKDVPEWDNIPWAEKIGDEFGTPAGISFAFVNLGKTRLSTEGTHADVDAIDMFCQASTRTDNYISRQIKHLKPDVVISMNLRRWKDYLGDTEILEENENVRAYKLLAKDHKCLLLDTWHFSSRKNQKTKIYQPIRDAFWKWGRL